MRAMVILPINVLISYFCKLNSEITDKIMASTDVLFNSKTVNFSKISIYCYKHNKEIIDQYSECKLL